VDGSVPGIVLLDGFTGGTWRIARQHGTATLTVRPLKWLSAEDTAALTAEGVRLLRFVAPDAQAHDIHFTSAA
jgi:hypothetical protein